MYGSDRGKRTPRVELVLPAIGFVLAAAIIWALGYSAGSDDPEKYRYQPYLYATDKPQEIDPALARPIDAKPFEYRAPCQKPKGKDESDLCAQWRSAEAAENSAFWTKWGFWIATIGSAFLLWQIILTRRAVEDTGKATQAMLDANELADKTAQRQLRPYLSPSRAWFKMDDSGEPIAEIFIKNYGQTPAINKRGWTHTWVECFPLHNPLPDAPEELEMGSSVIGPGGTSEATQPHGVPLKEHSRTEIEAGRAALYVYGAGTYLDIFGKEHSYSFIFFASGKGSLERGRLAAYVYGNEIDV